MSSHSSLSFCFFLAILASVLFGYSATDLISNEAIRAVSNREAPQGCPCSCVNLTNGAEGTFASPNYPNNYPNNLYQCWIISSITGTVTFKVVDFVTERGTDKLEFYQGFNTPSTTNLLFTLEGDVAPGYNKTITGLTDCTILFVTDQTSNFKGFRMYYTVTDSRLS